MRDTCCDLALVQRFRLAMVTGRLRKSLCLLATGIAICSCGSPGHATSVEPVHSNTHTTKADSPPTTLVTTTTTAVPASESTCDAAQLVIRYAGGQGATGNLTAGFRIADQSPTPCAIRSSVTVNLVDRFGAERSASAPLLAAIPLSAGATLPSSSGVNPPPGEQLGSLVLAWPTLPNAIDALTSSDGGPDAQCPQPLFTPVVARITFGGEQPVTVNQLSIAGPGPSSVGSFCGNFVRIWGFDSLN
jgi:hypothetical protein